MKALYAADIAKMFSVSLSGARAWLVELEKEHGPHAVGRFGKKLFTSDTVIRAKYSLLTPVDVKRAYRKLAKRLTALARFVREIDERLYEVELATARSAQVKESLRENRRRRHSSS